MFAITMNKGFHIKFANGCTVSVQWGRGNYCQNYNYSGAYGAAVPQSADAEVAAWDADGNYIPLGDGDDVAARQSPEQVAVLIAQICTYQPKQKLIEAQ